MSFVSEPEPVPTNEQIFGVPTHTVLQRIFLKAKHDFPKASNQVQIAQSLFKSLYSQMQGNDKTV